MFFRQLFEPVSSTYTYLLADDYGKDAIIIDPVIEKLDLYLQLIKEFNLNLVYVIDTHVHADHITASGELRKALNCKILLGEQADTDCADEIYKEGDIIQVPGVELRAIYTPGHTNDSYSLLMSDRVFTGDILLIRATGRTDFQNGDSYQAYDSLFNKLLKLPDDTLVYPCHDYKGMMVSTIGEEKRFNPRLQVSSAKEYAELMANLNLDKPKQIDVAVPANLKCGLNKD